MSPQTLGRVPFIFLLVCFVLALVPAPAAAQSWYPAGFGGAGAFIGLTVDPSTPSTIYLSSDVAGVYRSTNSGDTWQMASTGLGNAEISSLAVDPFDGNRLYAGAGAFTDGRWSGMYLSTDRGTSWSQLPASRANRISYRRYSTAAAIAMDPAQQDVLLTGTKESGIWRSTDGGQSFGQVLAAPMTSAVPAVEDPNEPRPAPPYPAPVAQVRFDPGNPSLVVAAFDGAGVYRSASRGQAGSWVASSAGLPAEATVEGIAFGGGNTMFAAVGRAGLYRSTDRGVTWTVANGNLPLSDPELPWVSSVAAHPTASPPRVYVALVCYNYQSIWTSDDLGVTWNEATNITYDTVGDPTRVWTASQTWTWMVTMDPTNPSRLYYVDFWGCFRSDDAGASWVEKVVGAQNVCVTDILYDTDHPASQPDSVWVTHWDCGLLRSTDGGQSFVAVLPFTWDPAIVGHNWGIVATNVGGQKYLFTTSDPGEAAYTIGQVLRSTDDGATWQQVFSNPRPTGTWLGGFMIGMAVDPSAPSTIYVLQDGGQIWKSTSNGAPGSWAPTGGQPGTNDFTYGLTVDAAGRIFVGTLNNGLWRSTNGGASWQATSLSQSTVFRVLASGNVVYASGGDANLHRSTDGGASWQQLTAFTPPVDPDGASDQGSGLAVDPNDPAHLLFARLDPWHPGDASAGVVESTDGGATWTDANQGLGLTKVSVMTIGTDGSVWAGTNCAGTWRRGTAGAGGFEVAVGRGPDPAGSSQVAILSTTGTALASVLPYGTAMLGCNVGDGQVREPQPGVLLTGPGPSGVFGPHVRGFDAPSQAPIAKISFYAYGTLRFGVKPAAADVDGDGHEEMLTGPGPGAVFGPHVRGWNFDASALSAISKINFFAYGTLKYGVNPAGGGVDQEPSFEEIATGPGPGNVFAPQARGFDYDGVRVAAIPQLNAVVFTNRYGLHVGAGNLDGGATQEILCSRGPDPLNAGDVAGLGYGNRLLALGITYPTTVFGAVGAAGDIGSATPEEVLVAPGPQPSAPTRVRGWVHGGSAYVPSSIDLVPFTTSAYGGRVAAGTFF